MKTTTLGASGISVTPLGFGSAPIANLYSALDDATAQGAVRGAWDAGVRYFDTAPHYGVGLAERRLGSVLRDYDRASFTVSTKVGRVLVPDPAGAQDLAAGFHTPASHRREWNFSRDGIRRSVEDSLQRLGLARVDVLLLHDPDDHYETALAEAYPALHELRAEGTVGAIGAGMNQSAMLTDFVRETDMDVVMLAGRYTLLEQSALIDLLPLCTERRVSVLIAGPFNSGLLAAERPTAGAYYDYSAASADILARANLIADICERHGATLPQAALHFPLAHPAVASVVAGARTAAEVARNAALLAQPVAVGVWSDLKSEGLLASDAPVPGG